MNDHGQIAKQTFREYTERRIDMWEKMADFVPEMSTVGVAQSYRKAYTYDKHMEDVKERFEEIFETEMQWAEVDQFSQILSNKIQPVAVMKHRLTQPTSHEEAVDNMILIRKEFCEVLGCKFPEDRIEEYKESMLESRKMMQTYHQNVVKVDVKTPKEEPEEKEDD